MVKCISAFHGECSTTAASLGSLVWSEEWQLSSCSKRFRIGSKQLFKLGLLRGSSYPVAL